MLPKNFEFRRFIMGTGTGNFSFFWLYWYQHRKNMIPRKSLGTGMGKKLVPEKLAVSVSKISGYGKSIGIGII